MSTTDRDKYLSRYEILLKVFCGITEVSSFIISIFLLSNAEENQTNLIVGLVLLLAMPLLVWLMYSVSMVLVSFFYDTKMIRNRLNVIEERTRSTQKTDSSGDATSANNPESQKSEMKSEKEPSKTQQEKTAEVSNQEVEDVIRILNQGK